MNINSSEIEQETSFINTDSENSEIHSVLPNCGTVWNGSDRGITWDALLPPDIIERDYEDL